MAKKPTVLLVLSESIANTVVVSQALGHVRVMQDHGIADFHILALTWNAALKLDMARFLSDAEQISGSRISVVNGVRPGVPGSTLINSRRIHFATQALGISFSHIHARTDYATVIAAHTAQALDAWLIWDCRGDSLAELEFRPTDILGPFRKFIIASRIQAAGRSADRALFVSHALKERMAAAWPDSKYSDVIPCVASEKMFYFDPALRVETRHELGIGQDQYLYLYSGGLSPYQKFPETIEYFRNIKTADPNARLLVLTPDTKAASELTANVDGIMVRRAANTDVNRYLNAADAAFMLRDPVATNRVASPTKFSEYCLAGLNVIMTDAVADSYALAKTMGNIIDARYGAHATATSEISRRDLALRYRTHLSRESVLDGYSRLYAIE